MATARSAARGRRAGRGAATVGALLLAAGCVGRATPPPAAADPPRPMPPRPAPPPPPPPPPAGGVPPPPPRDDESLWREIDATLAAEDAAGGGAVFNLTDFTGAPVPAPDAERCRTALRQALLASAHGLGPRLYGDPLHGVRVSHRASSHDPRLVYFVMLSRPYSHLVVSRLIHALYHPSHLFLLHLDLKLNGTAQAEIEKYAAPLANVHVLRNRRLVQWGAFTMVSVLLDAIKTVVEMSLDFDFLINLSDADLALRTNAEVVAWLRPFKETTYSFMQVHAGRGELVERTLEFAERHPVVECGGYGFVGISGAVFDITPTPYCCFGRSGPVVYDTVGGVEVPRRREGEEYWSGSQWVILHRKLAEFIHRDETGRRWARVFERRVLSDEMFLQTLAMHSPYNGTLFHHNLRWIDWPHYHGDPGSYWSTVGWNFVGGPRVLRVDEAEAVFGSPFMFARKVDPEVDSAILHRWDDWMGRKLRGESPPPTQLPIGQDIGKQDPGVRGRFGPGLGVGAARRGGAGALPGVLPARRSALPVLERLIFADGSSCRCGREHCASFGDCCDDLAPGVCALGGDPAEAEALPPCPAETAGLRAPHGHDGGAAAPAPAVPADGAEGERGGGAEGGDAPATAAPAAAAAPADSLTFINRTPHPVELFALDGAGAEVGMGTLAPHGQALAFAAVGRAGPWRARSVRGDLLLELPSYGADARADSAERFEFEVQPCKPWRSSG